MAGLLEVIGLGLDGVDLRCRVAGLFHLVGHIGKGANKRGGELVQGQPLRLLLPQLRHVSRNLNAEAAREFIGNAFRDGSISASGTAITTILPPVSRFSKNNGHTAKKQAVLDKPAAFFGRYFGLG